MKMMVRISLQTLLKSHRKKQTLLKPVKMLAPVPGYINAKAFTEAGELL